MSFSNYCENYLLNLLFTNKTMYVGYGSAATESGMAELSGSGYARELFGAWSLTSVGVDVQEVSNDADIDFDTATGAQGTCAVFGFFDALTGGNFLGSVTLAELGQSDINVILGTQITIPAGDCLCRLD